MEARKQLTLKRNLRESRPLLIKREGLGGGTQSALQPRNGPERVSLTLSLFLSASRGAFAVMQPLFSAMGHSSIALQRGQNGHPDNNGRTKRRRCQVTTREGSGKKTLEALPRDAFSKRATMQAPLNKTTAPAVYAAGLTTTAERCSSTGEFTDGRNESKQ